MIVPQGGKGDWLSESLGLEHMDGYSLLTSLEVFIEFGLCDACLESNPWPELFRRVGLDRPDLALPGQFHDGRRDIHQHDGSRSDVRLLPAKLHGFGSAEDHFSETGFNRNQQCFLRHGLKES